jgi:hypothetical protein
MVGVATATTAWPHGNRGAQFFEWDTDGNRTMTDPGPNNLWMYQANVAGFAGTGPQSASNIPTPVDPSQTIITGAVGSAETPGRITDGTCLKCHIPTDSVSLSAMTGTPGTTINDITVVTARNDSVAQDVNTWLGLGTGFPNNPLRGHTNQADLDNDLRLDLSTTVTGPGTGVGENLGVANANPRGETPLGSHLIWLFR